MILTKNDHRRREKDSIRAADSERNAAADLDKVYTREKPRHIIAA